MFWLDAVVDSFQYLWLLEWGRKGELACRKTSIIFGAEVREILERRE